MGSRLLYALPALLLALLALILAIVGLATQPEPGGDAGAEAAATQPATARFHYWVATQAVQAGDALTAEDLTRIASPTEIPGAISADNTLTGKVLARSASPGELISKEAFKQDDQALPSLLPAGRRALAIPINEVSGIGGLLHPGDTVDVITAFNDSAEDKGPAALITLRNIPVLAVHGRLSPPEGDDDKRQREHNNTVVLSVPEDRVTALMLASTEGDIRLAMVSSRDVPMPAALPDAAPASTILVSKAKAGADDGSGQEPEIKPFYYREFFPEAHKEPVRHSAPSRPRGHRVKVFEGAQTRSTYVR